MGVTHLLAELYLNGQAVGTVTMNGSDASWGYGRFQPGPGFAEFAPLFGRWSLLMHADDDQARVSDDAKEELRQAEYAIDALKAKLYWPKRDEWTALIQVNIDGDLIEWKKE